MENIVTMTKNQIQENGARILKEAQDTEARALRLSQEETAQFVLDSSETGPPTYDILNARQLLKESQLDAAMALKQFQTEAAESLATANKKLNQAERDHAQAMRLLSGGYSIQS